MTTSLSVAALAHQIRQGLDQQKVQRAGAASLPQGRGGRAAGEGLPANVMASVAGLAGGGGFDASLMAALGKDNPVFLAESAQLAMAQQLFAGDGNDADTTDSDLFSSVLQGSMNGLNMQALQTLAKIQAARQAESAADQGAHTVRRDIDRTPLQEIEADILTQAQANGEVRLPINTTSLPLDLIAPAMSAASLNGLPAEVRQAINRIVLDTGATYVASLGQPPTAPAPHGQLAATEEAATGGAAIVGAASPQTAKPAQASAPPLGQASDQAAALAESITRPVTAIPSPQAPRPVTAKAAAAYAPAKPLPATGILSSRFESGSHGVAAIGFDRRGGTSYGKYQISSRTGTMDRFLTFLDNRAPAWAEKLRQAGPLDTGSREGAAPDAWQQLAAENPTRFGRLQDEFIHRANYRPALQNILEQTNINVGNHSPALREVLWSTAVQHGARGATEIFTNATQAVTDNSGNFEKSLIEAVYKERSEWFSRASYRVRTAVQSRLSTEKGLALSLLAKVNNTI